MNSSNNIEDVIIIGGGPAGSTAASFLAMLGHRVTLLEKEKFPRDHVGESLLPFCYGLFEQLGVLDKLTKRFVRKPGVRFIDKDGIGSTTWCFNRVIHDPSFLSFQVNRSEFDQILLENARERGACVREQTKVQDVDLSSPDGTVFVQAIGPRGGRQSYRAKFLLDASGRNSFLATRNGWRKSFEGLDRTAFWTHWHTNKLIGGLEEGLSLIVYLGGEKQGWIWIFPLDTDRLTVGVVMNNQFIRSQRSNFEQNGVEDWKTALFLQELTSSPLVNDILSEASILQPLRVEGNYSYYVDKENKFGSNFALIGDASTFIDPIFSSGIFLSINGSRHLAEAIHKKLSAETGEGVDAIASAYQKINGAYGIVYKLIRLFYNPLSISFAEAGGVLNSEHLSHENAMATGHFLLAGDFFERHEEYSKFIDLLQSPSLFKRFRSNVIGRKNFQADLCGTSLEDAFHHLLEEHTEISP
jgi:hypothetical protein